MTILYPIENTYTDWETYPVVSRQSNLSTTPLPCEPYQVSNFPWLTYFSDNYTSSYYNNPLKDGVSFNLNLGGYYNSWVGPGTPNASKGVYVYLIDKTASNLYVDGGIVYDDVTEPYIELDYVGTFPITDSIVKSKYQIMGGDPDGLNNPLPGHTSYPGVSSISGYPGSRVVQARNFGKPIIMEMWFSLNQSRTSPLDGYCNYTFFGVQNYPMPWMELTITDSYIKKYQSGIFNSTADMYNLNDSDFIAGVSFVGNNVSGVAKIIINGVVVQTFNTTKPVKRITSNGFNTVGIGSASQFGNAKSNVNYLEIVLRYGDATTEFIYVSNGYPYNNDTAGLIDTYLCKWAWIVDSETGLMEDNPVYAGLPSMFTVPGISLSCDPLMSLPNYIPPDPIDAQPP